MRKLKLPESEQQFDHNKISLNAATQITRLHEQTGFSDTGCKQIKET